jgi:hypothetical protein
MVSTGPESRCKQAAGRTEAIESEAEVSEKVPGIHVWWRGVSARVPGGVLWDGRERDVVKPPQVMAMAGCAGCWVVAATCVFEL